MNHITIIASFLLCSILGFTLTTIVDSQTAEFTYGFAYVIGVLSGIASIISVFIMVFNNLHLRDECIRNFNYIREYVRDKANIQKDVDLYKSEFKQILTDIYPEYEKDVFKTMAQGDAKELEVIMVKYPNLKFDGVLTNYVASLESKLSKLQDFDSYINNSLRTINNINDGSWMLGRIEMPEDIKTIQNKTN